MKSNLQVENHHFIGPPVRFVYTPLQLELATWLFVVQCGRLNNGSHVQYKVIRKKIRFPFFPLRQISTERIYSRGIWNCYLLL